MYEKFNEMDGYELVINEYEAPEMIQYRASRKYFEILPILSSLEKKINVMDDICEGLTKSQPEKNMML